MHKNTTACSLNNSTADTTEQSEHNTQNNKQQTQTNSATRININILTSTVNHSERKLILIIFNNFNNRPQY